VRPSLCWGFPFLTSLPIFCYSYRVEVLPSQPNLFVSDMSEMPTDDRASAPPAAWEPKRSKVGGFLLIVASPIVGGILLLALFAFAPNGQLAWLVGLFVLMGVGAGIRTGMRLRAPDAEEVMRRDPRPPIVFLRPFKEDHRLAYGAPVGPRFGGVTPQESKSKAGHERMLVYLLHGVGPIVAIGEPGEKLATLGAARSYWPKHQWQQPVEAMVRRAAAVVLQPERSSGTLWEFDLVVRVADRRRLLLLAPNPHLRPLGYANIRALVYERLAVTLPAADVCPPCDAFYLGDDGNPVPLLLETPRMFLTLPEPVWRFFGLTKEMRWDLIWPAPRFLLVPSKNLTQAAKPFLDRIAVLPT